MSLSASSELIANAQRIQARLRTPPNAVPDTGIDLKRLPRGFFLVGERSSVTQTIKIAAVQETQIVPIVFSSHESSGRLTVRGIGRFIAAKYEISFRNILGHSRTKNMVEPRHIAIWLARQLIPLASLPEIGRRLGGRDHTTILHACRKISARVLSDAEFAHDVAQLEATLIARQGEAVVQ